MEKGRSHWSAEEVRVPIFAINKSTAWWDFTDNEHPVFISYYLFDAKRNLIEYDKRRTPFDRIIKTDDSVMADLMVRAPSAKGEYYVEVDTVKEKVTWFKNK